jgi:hypothetical protein
MVLLTRASSGFLREPISRLPELVELKKNRNKARSRRKPQPLRSKPVTCGEWR